MTVREAQSFLNTLGRERYYAHRDGMDWMPDRSTRRKITDAYRVILASKGGEARLNRAGRDLYESEGRRLEEEEGLTLLRR